MTERYDLHSHTTASDGTNAPAVNVRLAGEAGLRGLAITDHDTVAGVAEAVAEGKRLGIDVVPGVEISTVAGGQDIHVLGYYIDTEDPLFRERLEQLRRTRNLRNEMILDRLVELGLPVTMDEVLEQSRKKPGKDETVGRPHIAAVLVAKGYVADMTEAFDRYLGKDAAAYVNPPRLRPEDAIDWIRDAGGVPILAHPGLYGDDEQVIRLIEYGVAGIEAYHSDHSRETEVHYASMAERYGLIATAGSDFHGSRGGVVFHAPLGARYTDYSTVERLQAASRYFERSRDQS
ncbi:PHP domain-containing protein [Paenibacillus hemerocallicola]|uniref:PHP domain-containing protein n=1 Tax=Paenibacillus hemerocallicola TaxID=1172614 RepID=A0A5C4TDT9_9BACL|nr:PHP domain-containing protein [Paenibacillus hemerocallicola]TNJ67191.1 PHP domain-containing protein [Paenibacillus hemerocallicola]